MKLGRMTTGHGGALSRLVALSAGLMLLAMACTAWAAPQTVEADAAFPFRADADAVLARQIETLVLPPAIRGLGKAPRLGAEASLSLNVPGLADIAALLPGAKTEFGRLSLAQGRYDEARLTLDDALAKEPGDIRALVARGLLAALTGDTTRADDLAARAAAVAPFDREVRYFAATWAIAQGRATTEPLVAPSDALTGAKPMPGAMTVYGMQLELAGRAQDARDAYAAAVVQDGKDVIALDLQANLDFSARDWSRATAEWSKVLQLEPGFHPARLGLAQSLWNQRRVAEAVDILDPARAQYDDGHLGVVLALLAQLKEEAGARRDGALYSAAAKVLNPSAQTLGVLGPQDNTFAIATDEALTYLRKFRPGAGQGQPPARAPETAFGPQLVIGDGSEYVKDSRSSVRLLPGGMNGLIGFWLTRGADRAEWRRVGIGPVPYDLGFVEGNQEVRCWAVTTDGWHLPLSARVTIDRTAPTGTIVINGGEPVTGSRQLTVWVHAADPAGPVVAMSFSQDGRNWSNWEPVAYRRDLTLTDGDGPRTVWARFKDQAGNEGLPVQASISLDTIPPSIYGVQVTTLDFHSVRVTWYTSEPASSRADLVPGLYSGTFEVTQDLLTTHEAVIQDLQAGENYYLRIYASDAVGNTGSPAETSFRAPADVVPPTGGFTVKDGNAEVNNPRVRLRMWSTDRESGVGAFRVSVDGYNWTDWRAVTTEADLVLTGGDGQKTIYVQYRDNAGNVSDTYRASTILDTRPLRMYSVHVTDITAHSAAIIWTTNERARSEVVVRGGGDTQRESENYPTTDHRVVITGLMPNTTYRYEVVCRDTTGDEARASDDFRTPPQPDNTPPRGMIAINNGAASTDRPDVTLHISATDNVGGPITVSLSNDRITWSRWERLAPVVTWRLAPGEGYRTVYARFQDQNGNVGEANASIRLGADQVKITDARVERVESDSATLTWSTSEPTTGSVTCVSGRDAWTASDDRSGRDHRVTVKNLRPQTSYTWTIRAVDASGRQVTSGTYQFQTPSQPDHAGPRGSITINNGAPVTTSLDVTLQVAVTDNSPGPLEMCFSNDQKSWSRWEQVARTKGWQLMPPAGQKTVYARFRDSRGNESKASASIRYETPGPRILQARVDNVSATSATLSWSTDVPTTGQARLTGRGDTRSGDDRGLGTSHRVTVDGLRPETTYSWSITATDNRGNSAQYDGGSLTTAHGQPTPPPGPPQPPRPPSPPPRPPQPPQPPQGGGGTPINVALKRNGASASASTGDSKYASEAIDGDPDTAWAPSKGGTQWIEITFKGAYHLGTVTVKGYVAGTGITTNVQYESNGRWVNAGTVSDKDSAYLKEAVGSRIRLQVVPSQDAKSDWYKRFRLGEVEVVGTP